MSDNIKLRPSSSERWTSCPGSARLEHGLPPVTSKYAEEGIKAHELAANFFESGTESFVQFIIDSKIKVSNDMAKNVNKYTDYVNELFNLNGSLLLIERKVDFSHVMPNVENATGTCDALIIDDKSGTLHVIDLKYGKGVKIEVKDNTQLLLYALGAWSDLAFLYDIYAVTMHIVQPRINNFDSQTLEIEDLEPWETFFIEKSKIALGDNPPRAASKKACMFCRAKTICPEYQEFNKSFSVDEFDNLTIINGA